MTRRNGRQLARFAIVGAIVALTYVALYLLLMRFGLTRGPANALAFCVAVGLQYLGQTRWTFEQPLKQGGQALRFIITICLGLAVSALITGFVGPAMGWPEAAAAVAVILWLPVQNFIFFRLWVYASPIQSAEG